MTFRDVDIPLLMRLRPVTSANVTNRPVALEDAEESVSKAFYGDLVAVFDQDNNIDLVYISEPIMKSRWMEAMSLVYANGYLQPSLRVYAYIQVEDFIPNDPYREMAWQGYDEILDPTSGGNLESLDAINVQTAHRLYELLDPSSPSQFDVLEFDRVLDLLMRRLTNPADLMLEVTDQNAFNMTAEKLETSAC